MKPGPIWHEIFWAGASSRWQKARPSAYHVASPAALGSDTDGGGKRVPIKAAQERLGHSRPDILLKFYAHVLDASADAAASSLSGH